MFVPWYLSLLAKAHAELGQFDEAWRCIGEAIHGGGSNQGKVVRGRSQSHRRRNRVYVARAGYGESGSLFRARARVARQQQAKSWELRASMSLARLWRDQGKVRKRANCWLRFTGGLRRGSTRVI